MVNASGRPRVSIVMPCRNEAAYIGPCLDSVLATDYPLDRLEVLVVDGRSDDGTRAIVEQCAARNPCVRLLDNPARITPVALNMAIRAATGDWLESARASGAPIPTRSRRNRAIRPSSPSRRMIASNRARDAAHARAHS